MIGKCVQVILTLQQVLSLTGAVPRHSSAWGQFHNTSDPDAVTMESRNLRREADNQAAAVIAPIVPTGVSLKAANLADVATTSTSVPVQTPTTTTGSQSTPDTTGVRIPSFLSFGVIHSSGADKSFRRLSLHSKQRGILRFSLFRLACLPV